MQYYSGVRRGWQVSKEVEGLWAYISGRVGGELPPALCLSQWLVRVRKLLFSPRAFHTSSCGRAWSRCQKLWYFKPLHFYFKPILTRQNYRIWFLCLFLCVAVTSIAFYRNRKREIRHCNFLFLQKYNLWSVSVVKATKQTKKILLMPCRKKLDDWAPPVLGFMFDVQQVVHGSAEAFIWVYINVLAHNVLWTCVQCFICISCSAWRVIVCFPSNCCASIQQYNYILCGLTLNLSGTFPVNWHFRTSFQKEARFLTYCDGKHIFWTFSSCTFSHQKTFIQAWVQP